MAPRWNVYSEVVEDTGDEEALNDCFADLIDDSLHRGPTFLNSLLDGVVEFGPDAELVGTDHDPLPHRDEGKNWIIDFTIRDSSKIVGFESKLGAPLGERQLEGELAKLECNAGDRDVVLVAVTEEWGEPGIISRFSDRVRWTSWFQIAQRVFAAEELDTTWNPTISRARKMFHEFGYREMDAEEADELAARIAREQERWDGRFVTEFRPDSWSDEWTAKSPAGHIFKKGWRLDDDLEPTTQKGPVALQFVHHLRDEDLVGQGRLKFQFRWDGGNQAKREYRDRFREWFECELEDAALQLQDRGITQGVGANVFTEKVYVFDVERFPTSYYETLREAFEEHQVIVEFLEKRPDVADIVKN